MPMQPNPIIDIHAHVTLPECQALVEGGDVASDGAVQLT
jgi:hypothetical protein